MSIKLLQVVLVSLLVAMLGSKFAYAAYNPDQVKAVYLYRIVNFIYWKDEEQMTHINICLPDNQKVYALMSEIIKGKVVRGKPIYLSNQDCDVVYLTQKSSMALLQTYPKNTVTVGDVMRFTDYGGALELVTKAGRIKPKINLSNIGTYRISSNLLRVSDVEGELK